MHYRKPDICRVLKALPRAIYRALGKVTICRVPTERHSATKRHSAKICFAECLFTDTRQTCLLPSATRAALGTQPHMYAAYARRARCLSRPLLLPLCRVPRSWHSAKTITSRGRYPLPRTLPLSFAECQVVALGKDLLMPSVIIMTLGI